MKKTTTKRAFNMLNFLFCHSKNIWEKLLNVILLNLYYYLFNLLLLDSLVLNWRLTNNLNNNHHQLIKNLKKTGTAITKRHLPMESSINHSKQTFSNSLIDVVFVVLLMRKITIIADLKWWFYVCNNCNQIESINYDLYYTIQYIFWTIFNISASLFLRSTALTIIYTVLFFIFFDSLNFISFIFLIHSVNMNNHHKTNNNNIINNLINLCIL